MITQEIFEWDLLSELFRYNYLIFKLVSIFYEPESAAPE